MQDTVHLLTIGNSFAGNALTYLPDLFRHAGDVGLHVGRANLGGCSLEKHHNLARYCAARPDYRPYALDGAARMVNLHEALRAAPWDVVTLQQSSALSWRQDTYEPHLSALIDLVREHAPSANVWLHQTWAYRADAAFYPLNGLTPERMHARIAANVAHFAIAHGCRVLPSGEAVYRARHATGRTFGWPDPKYDYQHAAAPALPDQTHSLAVGWVWDIAETERGVPALRLDPSHLNARGCYLASCTWFAALRERAVSPVAFVPDGLDAADAEFLRATADAAVADRA